MASLPPDLAATKLPSNLDAKPQQPKQAQADISSLQLASAVLSDQFKKDAQIVPDLGDLLATPGGAASALYSVYPDDYRVPFQKRRLVGIPEGLFQFYNSTNVTSHMGLIPEIERVWISIDHKLFLWDYVEGQEISSFVDQPDIITHVALVKPKPGLFIDEISHILVICTPISVLLIALSFETSSGPNNRAHKDIKLYATDLSVPTEIEMTSVCGTRDGRIFMCGAQDGNLYELHYQEKESWFGKRIQLINHSVSGMQSLLPKFSSSGMDGRITTVVSDPSRDCFYTLTSKNSISVYKPNGDKAIQHMQTLSGLYKAAADKAPGSPALTPQNFQIIALHPIEISESRTGLQLLAITANGVRLYFSPTMTYGYGPSTSSAPGLRALQLTHIRLPPTNLLHPDIMNAGNRPPVPSYGASQPQQSTTQPFIMTSIESSCYSQGLTLASQQGDTDGTDFLLCLSPDLTRIGSLGQVNMQPQVQQPSFAPNPGVHQMPLAEYATLLSIPGRTWAMAPVPRSSPSSGPGSPTVVNELAHQFCSPPHQFMILTNVGLTFLMKRRAVDYLRAVIEEYQSESNPQPIIEFRDSFGRDQTCAMLLGLACGNTFFDMPDSATSPMNITNVDIATVAKQAFYDFGERPMWAERHVYGGDAQGSAIYSGRREGFALYFARIVRPIWKVEMTKPGPSGSQQLSIPEDVLTSIQKNLYSLQDFLNQNLHLFHIAPGEPASTRPAAGNEQEAWKAEQRSVAQLMELLGRSIEALAFILLLNDYKLGELISLCDADTQQLIRSLTIEDLITTTHGTVASRALVNVIIDQQIGQQISVDTISEVLQQRCGSFCSTDDVMLYKAKENIRKAVETRSPTERQNWLAESLRLFAKGARNLEFEKLREICGDYQQLQYAKGAIELPLICAKAMDANNVASDAWYSGSATTEENKAICELRHGCYDLVLDSLQVFEEQHAASVDSREQEAVRTHAFELAFASDDEIFHSALYDWFIEHGMVDDLLELRPFYLEAHLKRPPATVQKYQLLWQFYVKAGKPLRAAEVLASLAESTEFDLSLSSRYEYLTLAVGNAKSHPISSDGRHETAIAFLTDLEEKLEVAQVQLEMYTTLTPHLNDPEVGERIQLLSKRLFTMSELYQDYAATFDMPVMKLLCFYVSEHRDETVVRPVWSQIFDEVLAEEGEPVELADRLSAKVIPLGQRFYPSESAFPLRHIAMLVVRFALQHRNSLPQGWAARFLLQCKIPYQEVWDVLHEMYESQVPPFHDQANVQTMSSEIAVLFADWLEEAKRPQSTLVSRGEFPVGRLDLAINQYMAELEPTRAETRKLYENIKRQLRHYW
ncbi:hypothetical protein CCMSSC00406_0004643 [Pleurotus cornucopiae]|nr:hypothetical protein CCMSSC00406_0004643 [Pleurotus cornucopiae]